MKPYHKNPRQITRKQMDNLRLWLAELGDLSGIVHDLNTDEIIGGNQRGMVFDVNKCEVELIDGPHEPDEQGTVAHGFIVWKGARYAYRQVRWDDKQAEKANIVANKAGGGWDFDTLANEFEVSDLIEWGFDAAELGIDLTGGTDDDAEPQIDRAEELREQWGVESGQLWRLPSRTPGQEHRLICGDCTDAAVVERVMGGERAALCFTDPPYNVGKDYGASTDDSKATDDYKEWSRNWFKTASMFSDGVAFTPGAVNVWMWAEIQTPKWMAIWVKKNQVSRNQAGGFNTYEPVLCYGKVKVNYDSWDIPVIQENASHPVPKTVAAWQKILQDLLHDNETILDLFLGSGTTIIAAENLSRQCRAVEISPAYVAVALQRYVDAFGIEPELVTG